MVSTAITLSTLQSKKSTWSIVGEIVYPDFPAFKALISTSPSFKVKSPYTEAPSSSGINPKSSLVVPKVTSKSSPTMFDSCCVLKLIPQPSET